MNRKQEIFKLYKKAAESFETNLSSAETIIFKKESNRETFKKILNKEVITSDELLNLVREGKDRNTFDKLLEEMPYGAALSPKSILFFSILYFVEQLLGTGHKIHDFILNIITMGIYDQATEKFSQCFSEKITQIYGDNIGILLTLIEISLASLSYLPEDEITVNFEGQIYRIHPTIANKEYHKKTFEEISTSCFLENVSKSFRERFEKADEAQKPMTNKGYGFKL